MIDSHHVGMKITVHPTKQVDVELHHMPAGANPQPGASVPGGAPSVQGMAADPMAAGMKNAMDQALASPQAPIQKPDATRGGSEAPKKAAKPAAKSVGKKPAAEKSKVKDKSGSAKSKATGNQDPKKKLPSQKPK